MKQMKKFAGILLVLAMILTVSVSALAAKGYNDNSGAITIDNAVVGQTYKIYQILKLESYNEDAKAYSYKTADGWDGFVKRTDINGTYLSIDDYGYVTWVDGANAAEFAVKAQAYAKTNNITAQKITTADSTTVKFTGLNLGYYLVDSTLGTLCSLDTTNPTVTIKEKNEVPVNVKTVEEDSTPGVYGSANGADIGQTVNFKSTITAQPGAENYVFEDTMSDGLTYNKDAKVYTNEDMTAELNSAYYTVNNTPGDGKTFTITFKQSYLNTITAETKLYVKYSATLNEGAVVGASGNSNKSTLKYGDSADTKSTPESKTTTNTWEINVYKYTMVKAAVAGQADSEKALAEAEFILYKDVKVGEATTRYYAIAADIEGGYRFTEWTETEASATKFVTPSTGKFAIKGLDSDTYYLEETTAPAGYNVLNAPVKVVIGENGSVTYGEDNTTASPDVKVLNRSGTELPSTGGMGTIIFYVLGSLLVVAAGVLLVTKKRMGSKA